MVEERDAERERKRERDYGVALLLTLTMRLFGNVSLVKPMLPSRCCHRPSLGHKDTSEKEKSEPRQLPELSANEQFGLHTENEKCTRIWDGQADRQVAPKLLGWGWLVALLAVAICRNRPQKVTQAHQSKKNFQIKANTY